MSEVWKKISFAPGYEVSSFGRVKGPRKGIMGGRALTTKGYLRVNINNKICFVHALVAKAFCPNPDNKPQVNHIDGNKLNNAAENLEWVTNQENRDHAVRLGLHPNRANGNCKITLDMIPVIKKLYASGKLQWEIAEMFGVIQQTISKVLRE